MLLVWLITILFLGGVIAWLSDRYKFADPRWVSIATIIVDLVLLIGFFLENSAPVQLGDQAWLLLWEAPWVPRFGISLLFGMDGFSLAMIALTLFLGIVAVLSSWTEIEKRSGFFHFNILWTLAGVVGVFTALDLFLFFFFWEVMLIPMYLLIGIWGHENRTYAAIKFFIFTQASGLLMLLSIVALAFLHNRATGELTFNYFELLEADTSGQFGFWLMLGFFIAFVVKLPGIPFHTWLPDAHTQAPTAGSVILAGVLLKTGAYGLIRFSVPLFPEASAAFATTAMWLGSIGVVYAAITAFAQTDIKRLIAYTSVSHMGFVLLGVYAGNEQAQKGAVMTMLAHGMTSAALFAFAGAMQQRIHTRDMREMGGFWSSAPRMGALVMFFSVAALGMPGLANFVGEFLVLLGSFARDIWVTVAATLGLVLAPIYSLVVIQRIFHGKQLVERQIADFGHREVLMMTMIMLVTIWLGVYPSAVLDIIYPGLPTLDQLTDVGITRSSLVSL